jgi:hypothetical protein
MFSYASEREERERRGEGGNGNANRLAFRKKSLKWGEQVASSDATLDLTQQPKRGHCGEFMQVIVCCIKVLLPI